MVLRQPARPRKAEATKAAIREAATTLFGERGFARTGVRDIAAVVGVDPALVNHHFGSKEALFLDVMSASPQWEQILSGPVETLGYRLVRAILEADAAGVGRLTFAALIRASDSPIVRRRLEESMELEFVAPLVDRLDDPDAELRARVFASQVQGIMTTLWIIEDEGMVTASRERLVEIYGRALQETLTLR